MRPCPCLGIRTFLLLLALNGWLSLPAYAADAAPSDGRAELALVREANRALEEEIKLASTPQIYLLLDLSARALMIKGRGLELHRIEVLSWDSAGGDAGWGSAYRLRARPAVERPKIQPVPGKDPGTEPAEPINVNDMPAEYLLQFDPGLLVNVGPPAGEQPWLWARSRLRERWRQLSAWIGRNRPTPLPRVLRLTLSQDEARSLAWSVTDGMPLVIGTVTAQ